MDFNDLMVFDEDSVGPLVCYVCDTTIGVVAQEVILEIEPFQAETLPVCTRCSSAVGVVVALEDQVDRLANEYVEVLTLNETAADLLMEGVQVVATLTEQNTMLKATIDADDAVFEFLNDTIIEQSNIIADLERRIQQGAGLNDVEFNVIGSASYEE
jgi:hypothetical protein